MEKINTIIISRTDSIGDVVLTLPIAHVLKQKFPGCKIIFLGKSYTKPVIECCTSVDQIICWDETEKLDPQKQIDLFRSLKADCIVHVFPNKKVAALAKQARIPIRIGTSHRFFHWFSCNKLPNFTRKNSDLHEAQLNFELLAPLGIENKYSLKDIQGFFDLTKIKPLNEELKNRIDRNRFNLILHPGSKGSAQEWSIGSFSELVKLLPKDKFQIFITGTKQEGEMIRDIFSKNDNVVNLTGKLSLPELISFIDNCDGLVAASTGPLHIAAVLGKRAIGLFSSKRPIFPLRWAPLGPKALFIESENVSEIMPKDVAAKLLSSIQ